MIIRYLRRKIDYDVVNVRVLAKVAEILEFENVDRKEALSLLKSAVQFDEKVAVLVGFEENGVINIGWAKCRIDVEDFDKEFGKALAISRAITYTDKFNEAGAPDNVPYIVEKALPEFVDRCLRYYQDKPLAEWVNRYLGL
jgi:hypothetical protein